MASVETAPALAAHDLGFAYPGRTVLGGVDLEVRAGEVVGLLGPNGSGKTTLVRVLSGVARGYSGSARVLGREVRSAERRWLARAAAVVPQETSFAFSFTVLEVVLMGRHPHLAGLAFEGERDLEVARQALDRCGASELATRNVLALSAGERQRVVMARALAQQPRILLLDEAASFMDVRHQVETYDRVRELAADGVAVLAVLHDLNLAAEYCDRLVLTAGGAVVADGPPRDVLTEARVSEVYRCRVAVDVNPATGAPRVTPLPRHAAQPRSP